MKIKYQIINELTGARVGKPMSSYNNAKGIALKMGGKFKVVTFEVEEKKRKS